MAEKPRDEQPTNAGRGPQPRDVTEPTAPRIEVEVELPEDEVVSRASTNAYPVVDNRYRVFELLGRGGMGEVYKAEHLGVGNNVAIKVLTPIPGGGAELSKRFDTERRALARLTSSHVVSILDVGVMPDGREFFVMPFIEGVDVQRLLKQHGPLPVRRAIGIVDQALKAVDAAHKLGIIHRDLKPSNLMLRLEGGDDHVYVVDFGIAKLRDNVTGEHTQQGFVVGTPGYMAPEQLTGSVTPELAHLLDIYALGIVLFELVEGRRPHASASASAEMRDAAREGGISPQAALRAKMPPWLLSIIQTATHADARARFPSAEAFRQALKNGGQVVVERVPSGTVVDDRDSAIRIDENLGRGGQGTVYAATDLKLGTRCAVKFLTARFGSPSWDLIVERFYRDRLANLIQHPNVVRVLDRGEWCGHKYLVLEFLEGRTLRACWTELSWPQMLEVMKELAAALDATHAAGIVHRDVTPENVMVSLVGGQLRVKLFDFGLSRTSTSTLTRPSTVEPIGRPGYIAPEQMLEPDGVGPDSDQWSAAAITYEWLSQRLPHREPGDDPDPNVALDRLLQEDAPSAPLPGEQPLNAVLLRALARDRGARFPSVGAFVEALQAAPPPVTGASVGPPTPSGAVSAPVSSMAWSRNATTAQVRPARRVTLAIAATVLLGGLGAGAYFWKAGGATAGPRVAATSQLGDASPSPSAAPPVPAAVAAIEPSATADAAPPAVPHTVSVTLSSPIRGATAVVDGQALTLPVTITKPAGTRLPVLIERRGYDSKTVDVAFEVDGEQPVGLERSSKRASTPSPPAAPKKREARQLYMDLDDKPSADNQGPAPGPK